MITAANVASAIESARDHALPGREAVEVGDVWARAADIRPALLLHRRPTFTVAFSDAPYSSAVKLLNIVAIIVAMGLCFLAGDSAAYFIVRAISN
jgi:hypothetical protein